MEDGEINGGFLGDAEMEDRKALAAVHGGTNMSWVEAVLIGTGQVKASDVPDAAEARGQESSAGDPADPDAATTAVSVQCRVFTFPMYPFCTRASRSLLPGLRPPDCAPSS